MKKYSWIFVALALSACVLPHAKGPADAQGEPDLTVVDDVVASDEGTADALDDVAVDSFDAITADVDAGVTVVDVVDVPAVRDVPTCPTGQSLCGGACIPTAMDLLNCGGCGQACVSPVNGTVECAASACNFTCNPGFRLTRPSPNSLTATCAADVMPSASMCPGQALTLVRNGTLKLVGTTTGAGGVIRGTGNCGMLVGPEVAFTINVPATGSIRFDLTSFEGHGIYVNTGMCMGAGMGFGPELGCSYTGGPVRARRESIALDVTAGQVLTLIVDSINAAGGVFGLAVTQEDQCSNDIRNSTHSCGDGNVNGGDGCSDACAIEPGRIVNSCMDARTPFTLTNRRVTLRDSFGMGGSLQICGLGSDEQERIISVLSPAANAVRFELQPDRQGDVTLSVRPTCNSNMGERCANNANSQVAGERLDVMVNANQSLSVVMDSRDRVPFTLRIIPRNCGDGVLAAAEECDDGNMDNGDGCSNACVVEAACTLNESMMDSTLAIPSVLPNCGVVRMSGRLAPEMMDKDDAARIFLRAGEQVRFQIASGPQGACPRDLDTIVEVSQGVTAVVPMMRNVRCSDMNPSVLCVDDGATLCSEETFVAPADRWYTFRVFHYDDAHGPFDYSLLIQRQR